MSSLYPFEVEEFRALTASVIASELPGFWSDWTNEQRALYRSGDWLGFSKSRGYSHSAMADYALWREHVARAQRLNVDPFKLIRDLTLRAALNALKADARGEFLLSSHVAGEGRIFQHSLEDLLARLDTMETELPPDDTELLALLHEVRASIATRGLPTPTRQLIFCDPVHPSRM